MLSARKPVGAPAREHLELQAQLALLGEQQARQRRVADRLDRHLGEPLGGHGGVVLQVAVPERRARRPSLEPPADLGEVDRREVEQEAEAAGQVGQLTVDREVLGGEPRWQVTLPRRRAHRAGAAPTPRRRPSSSSRC